MSTEFSVFFVVFTTRSGGVKGVERLVVVVVALVVRPVCMGKSGGRLCGRLSTTLTRHTRCMRLGRGGLGRVGRKTGCIADGRSGLGLCRRLTGRCGTCRCSSTVACMGGNLVLTRGDGGVLFGGEFRLDRAELLVAHKFCTRTGRVLRGVRPRRSSRSCRFLCCCALCRLCGG